jgi:hypothetical protein
MNVGDIVRFKVEGDRYDGLRGKIISTEYSGTFSVMLLEYSKLHGPFRKGYGLPYNGHELQADADTLVLVSPLELLAMEAD